MKHINLLNFQKNDYFFTRLRSRNCVWPSHGLAGPVQGAVFFGVVLKIIQLNQFLILYLCNSARAIPSFFKRLLFVILSSRTPCLDFLVKDLQSSIKGSLSSFSMNVAGRKFDTFLHLLRFQEKLVLVDMLESVILLLSGHSVVRVILQIISQKCKMLKYITQSL